MKIIFLNFFRFHYFLSIAVLLLLVVGCLGGSSGGGQTGSEAGAARTVPFGVLMGEVDVIAGETKQVKFIYDIPQVFNAFPADLTDVTVDVASTLGLVNVATSAHLNTRALAENQVWLGMWIDDVNNSETVCDTGEFYGPLVITLDQSNQPATVEPATVSASQPTLSVINTGSFAVCIEIVSPVSASIDIADADVNYKQCSTEAGDFDGFWTSTYVCNDECYGASEGENSFHIMQDGHSLSYYSGEGATGSGTACGDTFRFDSKGTDFGAGTWEEFGTMVLNANGTINAIFDYQYVSGACFGKTGHCEDVLTRSDAF